jgi:zinc transporter ZupT
MSLNADAYQAVPIDAVDDGLLTKPEDEDKAKDTVLHVIMTILCFTMLAYVVFFFSAFTSNSQVTWMKGLLVGFLPCITMTFGVMLSSTFAPEPHIEACFQNIASGLLLGAIGLELFPMMDRTNTTTGENVETDAIGIFIGFTFGLTLLFGVEHLVDSYVEEPEPEDPRETMVKYEAEDSDTDVDEVSKANVGDSVEISDVDLENAYNNLKKPAEMRKVSDAIEEICNTVDALYVDIVRQEDENLTDQQATELVDSIDKGVHHLHYATDRAKRLLEGYKPEIKRTDNAIRAKLKVRVTNVKKTSEHIREHWDSDVKGVSKQELKEVFHHLEDLDKQLTVLHEAVESTGKRWRRPLPETVEGQTVPFGLVFPIIVDGFMDGILLGVVAGLNFNAGIEVCAATMLEMGFLGLTVGVRVGKCTGSSYAVRVWSMYLPAFIIVPAALAGVYLTSFASTDPILLVGFVAFGTAALLYLVCVELIPEAKEANESDGDRKWVTAMIFFAIYITLVYNSVTTAQALEYASDINGTVPSVLG